MITGITSITRWIMPRLVFWTSWIRISWILICWMLNFRPSWKFVHWRDWKWRLWVRCATWRQPGNIELTISRMRQRLTGLIWMHRFGIIINSCIKIRIIRAIRLRLWCRRVDFITGMRIRCWIITNGEYWITTLLLTRGFILWTWWRERKYVIRTGQ